MKPTLTLLTALLLVPLAALHAADAPKPNIIFLLSDDQTIGAVGCYGNKDVITPNLDKLGRPKGVRYHFGNLGNSSGRSAIGSRPPQIAKKVPDTFSG